MLCPNCKNEISENDQFCIYCGEKIVHMTSRGGDSPFVSVYDSDSQGSKDFFDDGPSYEQEPVPPAQEAPGQKKKGKLPLVLLLAIAAVLVIGLGVFAAFRLIRTPKQKFLDAQINLIRYGAAESITPIEQWGLLIQLPVELLESISFVDTPGTNAVITEHEVLTRWFLPRADMVIFLSSTDRPFSESENQFLQSIRDWGKKTILILNKIDLLQTQEEKDKVIDFVRTSAKAALNIDIPVIPVSSRLAKKARSEMSQELWRESGFEALEQYIQDKMDEKARFRMKMLSALGS